ncbi:hypothetical protein K504DRAFT_501358 [Pleomassaria siparia CBS 279.74]|uniref:PQ-loop-domain-containing protein n=1 Tax=Pleomassaria siparia CBS 279.74 TaxID=1314801 RepID=A0A6G1KC11_9PLEO|nr:hypothetical protein K504DRAFT_501358 [Pleomassaria siparia CBS 279.74]
MPPYVSPLHIIAPTLPDRCEPANAFLYNFSTTFHTCVPTNLALLSTILGTCSIISWLFAQLPQIYKNHQVKSTSGLSIFFLAEWLLGDLSNLLGSLFTRQASWQVIIAGYYVSVDCALVAQWIWYELLKHGRPLRPVWGQFRSEHGNEGGAAGMQQVWDGVSGSRPDSLTNPTNPNVPADKKDTPQHSSGRNIPNRSNPMDVFRIPNFARSPGSTKEFSNTPPLGSTPNRTVHRLASSSSPMPSPKTILYISLIIAVLSNTSNATAISPFAPMPYNSLRITTEVDASPSASDIAGKVLSWMSTFLYLGSRLPQLYKNHVRKSTVGLSSSLFAAAFFGNLFYSSSLFTNPCAWYEYAAGEGAGWVDPEGSVRSDWILRAAPFFLGAAGVLIMDAAVVFQFWYFGDAEPRGRPETRDEEVMIVLNDEGYRRRRRFRWRRVSGWMRGWVPNVSVAGTPNVSRATTPAETPRGGSPKPDSPRGALDEARALLGTERTASPRGYGGTW